jgi:L-amino acid N-acyltransferase YncA
MSMGYDIRPVRGPDAAAIADIYAPFVRETSITFELVPPDAAEISRRVASVTRNHPWLVCAEGDALLGYAYATEFRSRAAYRWVAETAIYVRLDMARCGIGRALYARLIDELRRQGYVAAIGVLTLPNAASVGLHEAMGFEQRGVLPGSGYKMGCWHDVGIWQRELGPRPAEPMELREPFAR